jgi:two-component system response regulator RegA
MPGRSGLELVTALLEIDPGTRVVVLTGYGSIATAVEAMRRGACNYLQKPVGRRSDPGRVRVLQPGGGRRERVVGAPEVAEGTPTLARVEWEHLQRVLHDCGGNISEAARRLGMHRRSLQRKLWKNPPQT